MMAELMDEDMRHELLHRHIAALGPFEQDRHAVEIDERAFGRGVCHALDGQRHADIEAGELQRVVDVQLVERLVLSIVHDEDAHIAGGPLHELGQVGEAFFRRQIHFLCARRDGGERAHASVTAVPATATSIIEPPCPMTE